MNYAVIHILLYDGIIKKYALQEQLVRVITCLTLKFVLCFGDVFTCDFAPADFAGLIDFARTSSKTAVMYDVGASFSFVSKTSSVCKTSPSP